jgi:hypothetical protein
VLDDFDLELACDLGFGAWAWLCPLFVVLGFAPYSWRLALPSASYFNIPLLSAIFEMD